MTAQLAQLAIVVELEVLNFLSRGGINVLEHIWPELVLLVQLLSFFLVHEFLLVLSDDLDELVLL